VQPHDGELMRRHETDIVLRLIAVLKIAKALGLIAIGIGALSIRHDHTANWFGEWIAALAVDPHGKYVNRALAKLTALDAHELREIGVGSLIYALVFVVEGVGLMLRKLWAEVMTALVTTSFIPLEIYEIEVHASLAKAVVIGVNVVVVIYLLWRLRREKHWPFQVLERATQRVVE
jgi:uncharacterized membrane protein (DUF2068 family)